MNPNFNIIMESSSNASGIRYMKVPMHVQVSIQNISFYSNDFWLLLRIWKLCEKHMPINFYKFSFCRKMFSLPDLYSKKLFTNKYFSIFSISAICDSVLATFIGDIVGGCVYYCIYYTLYVYTYGLYFFFLMCT